MHWFSTVLLIALTAGTAVWTGYLLRRLFLVAPAGPEVTATADPVPSADPNTKEPNA